MVYAQTMAYVIVHLDLVFAMKDLKEICVKVNTVFFKHDLAIPLLSICFVLVLFWD